MVREILQESVITGKWICPSYMAVKDEIHYQGKGEYLREFLTSSDKIKSF